MITKNFKKWNLQTFIDKYRNASRPDIDHKIDAFFTAMLLALFLIGAYSLISSDSSIEYLSYMNYSIHQIQDGQGYVMLMYNSIVLGLTSGFIIGLILIYMFISKLILNKIKL